MEDLPDQGTRRRFIAWDEHGAPTRSLWIVTAALTLLGFPGLLLLALRLRNLPWPHFRISRIPRGVGERIAMATRAAAQQPQRPDRTGGSEAAAGLHRAGPVPRRIAPRRGPGPQGRSLPRDLDDLAGRVFPSRPLFPPRAIGRRPDEMGGHPRAKRPVRNEEPYSTKNAAARSLVPVVGPLNALEVPVSYGLANQGGGTRCHESRFVA
jgi:hypothetical protein